MPKFEDFIKPPEDNFFGDFQCQMCDECVESAFYDNETNILKWQCPAGHKSIIKDFL